MAVTQEDLKKCEEAMFKAIDDNGHTLIISLEDFYNKYLTRKVADN
jgi:uncharacterized iron-regulated protein